MAGLLGQAKDDLAVPIAGVAPGGQRSTRKAVAKALPGAPYQLRQFRHLREAARPVHEADRHAKKGLKERARGVRPIERQLGGRQDPEAAVIRGYCGAARGALTDDGRPPLVASGLRLHDRLSGITASPERVAEKRGYPGNRNG